MRPIIKLMAHVMSWWWTLPAKGQNWLQWVAAPFVILLLAIYFALIQTCEFISRLVSRLKRKT